MRGERAQRRIERLLDEAEAAMDRQDWTAVLEHATAVLALDPQHVDALDFKAAAERMLGAPPLSATPAAAGPGASAAPVSAPAPVTFAQGRYRVATLLGEGGKKRVYRAHDTRLGRDVAFALIKTEGLNAEGRARLDREARAMARLSDHPHIVTVHDLGDEHGQPYLVSQLMVGGSLEALLAQAAEHRLPVEQTLTIAQQICQALEHVHAHGVVHRDLKPGNVWLTQDGTAKLGDFGLAVALDQTRHTQPGMMVGTVAYMAPEQALSGEVGPRSDLYSLGALVYEMICGRPPFVGDESVAIITQHLNTPPVAPSWHRPECPPVLEALTLRLLEKDPAQRPSSAADVRQALASVDVETPRRELSIPAATVLAESPLYHRTFVGREQEVQQLHSAFDGALSGNGSLVMVVGEPGIGKTALCEQLATYVALRGGKALVGHCYEEGSLSLPYLAFVEAMRSYVLARDPDGLRSDLGTGAADVARIVSEVRDRVQVELRPVGDPEDDRWRLIQAVISFLRNASSVQPLLLVLEDLHWADRGTLDLLLHLARNLQAEDATGRRARLLIVGTYRDVEVDRAHPLSGTLAELRRMGSFLRVPLRGLTVDEVHRMYQAIRGQDVPWAQAEAVHRQTEGNPLFVQEVLRYLVEEGLVVREGGRWVPQQGVGAGIPEGLRDVVGKRLSRLSAECNRLLAVAAVIGRDFDLATLRGVAGLGEEELLAGIEEAVRVGVLEERSLPGAVRYRFAHAFFRQTLYEEMIAPRRLRLHQEVARVLEAQYAARREEHAAELAEHFGHSTDRADLGKAVEYSELAARRAMSVFAYAEAEAHLQRCLGVQEVLDPDDALRRCDLLLAMAESILPQGNPTRVIGQATEEAFVLADARGDAQRAVRAALISSEALLRGGSEGQNAARSEAFERWCARADTYARGDSVERIRADIYVGFRLLANGRLTDAHASLRGAVQRALDFGDNAAFFTAAQHASFSLRALRDRGLRQQLADEIVSRPHEGIRSADLASCLFHAGRIHLERGDRATAEACWAEARDIAARTSDMSLAIRAQFVSAHLAYMDGRLEEALKQDESTDRQAREMAIRTVHSAGQAMLLRRYLGLAVGELLSRFDSPDRPTRSRRAVLLALLGQVDEARTIAHSFKGFESDTDETSEQILANLLEVAVLICDSALLDALVPKLALSSGRLTEGILAGALECSVGRLLGAGAALLGKPDDARTYYQQALEVSEAARFRPEIALIRLGVAELLLDHYPDERSEALADLDFSVAEFREMKMQPALERAVRRKLELQGINDVSPSTSIDALTTAIARDAPDLRPHAAPDGTVTLLFTDIEDSTGLTLQLGDQRWLEILRAHHALIRRQVRDHGGFEVKSQGDGFMLAFQSARRALECAVAIQRACAVESNSDGATIRLRIGLHTGDVIRDDNDFHGVHVIMAARIADQASGGEILVSALLKDLTEGDGDLRFGEPHEVNLKGLTGAQRVYAVAWQ